MAFETYFTKSPGNIKYRKDLDSYKEIDFRNLMSWTNSPEQNLNAI